MSNNPSAKDATGHRLQIRLQYGSVVSEIECDYEGVDWSAVEWADRPMCRQACDEDGNPDLDWQPKHCLVDVHWDECTVYVDHPVVIATMPVEVGWDGGDLVVTPNLRHPDRGDDIPSTGQERELYRAARAATRWLDANNGTSREELALRILKVSEEVGEVASAWIGATGQNPRKGVTHSYQDVVSELADVVLSALTAMCSLETDPAQIMDQTVDKVLALASKV